MVKQEGADQYPVYYVSHARQDQRLAQALSDFIAEMSHGHAAEVWKVYVDGASNNKGSGVGAVFISSTGEKVKLAVKLYFRASNNEAEHEAVLVGFRAAKEMGVDRIILHSDSQLAIQQVDGTYEIKNERLVEYLSLGHQPPGQVTQEQGWIGVLLRYMIKGELPNDLLQALQMRRKALHFVLIDNTMCEGCQRYGFSIKNPASVLKPILATCPFDQWGLDIVEPFPMAPAQNKFLIVAVDYFSKWVEAEEVARIIKANANGQTMVTKRSIVQTLKAQLYGVGRDWVEELPSFLWAYRTTPRTATGKTPFSMIYGSEAILPAEIGASSAWVLGYGIKNDERRAAKLNVGDLVLRKAQPAGEVGKLDPKWEGPFKIIQKTTSGAYYLEDDQGHHLK
ncbi:uncharacterized protein [Henckelia pumila]|uniref:uncharacterized protein n=1 Tax=Henckelia pumila TaxID=405737 RepID=UPI003C6E47FE